MYLAQPLTSNHNNIFKSPRPFQLDSFQSHYTQPYASGESSSPIKSPMYLQGLQTSHSPLFMGSNQSLSEIANAHVSPQYSSSSQVFNKNSTPQYYLPNINHVKTPTKAQFNVSLDAKYNQKSQLKSKLFVDLSNRLESMAQDNERSNYFESSNPKFHSNVRFDISPGQSHVYRDLSPPLPSEKVKKLKPLQSLKLMSLRSVPTEEADISPGLEKRPVFLMNSKETLEQESLLKPRTLKKAISQLPESLKNLEEDSPRPTQSPHFDNLKAKLKEIRSHQDLQNPTSLTSIFEPQLTSQRTNLIKPYKPIKQIEPLDTQVEGDVYIQHVHKSPNNKRKISEEKFAKKNGEQETAGGLDIKQRKSQGENETSLHDMFVPKERNLKRNRTKQIVQQESNSSNESQESPRRSESKEKITINEIKKRIFPKSEIISNDSPTRKLDLLREKEEGNEDVQSSEPKNVKKGAKIHLKKIITNGEQPQSLKEIGEIQRNQKGDNIAKPSPRDGLQIGFEDLKNTAQKKVEAKKKLHSDLSQILEKGFNESESQKDDEDYSVKDDKTSHGKDLVDILAKLDALDISVIKVPKSNSKKK